jgi:sulfur relay (sulfurtransferase) complex TusBCD TusD component (DsrE family)
MARYLLIESRDPFELNGVTQHFELAASLVEEGNTVTLFLVQNGVLPARRGPQSEPLSAAAKAGVEVLADDFSLRERGIGADRLAAGIAAASLDVVVDQLAEGRKAMWL